MSHTERINNELIYYGTNYHFKFTDEKYHRYATLIVKPQHIELLSNNTDLSASELKEVIVEEWFGLENEITREANNKKRRKQWKIIRIT